MLAARRAEILTGQLNEGLIPVFRHSAIYIITVTDSRNGFISTAPTVTAYSGVNRTLN